MPALQRTLRGRPASWFFWSSVFLCRMWGHLDAGSPALAEVRCCRQPGRQAPVWDSVQEECRAGSPGCSRRCIFVTAVRWFHERAAFVQQEPAHLRDDL